MKKEIEKLDHFGRGITFVDGKICFVENALPGEIVKIKIVKETKKYLLARVVDYYKLSDNREIVKCRYTFEEDKHIITICSADGAKIHAVIVLF